MKKEKELLYLMKRVLLRVYSLLQTMKLLEIQKLGAIYIQISWVLEELLILSHQELVMNGKRCKRNLTKLKKKPSMWLLVYFQLPVKKECILTIYPKMMKLNKMVPNINMVQIGFKDNMVINKFVYFCFLLTF